MAADQLELGADDAFLGQKCNDLMPEEVRVDAFLNPCCQGVLMNDLTDATIGIGPEAVGLEEKNCGDLAILAYTGAVHPGNWLETRHFGLYLLSLAL